MKWKCFALAVLAAIFAVTHISVQAQDKKSVNDPPKAVSALKIEALPTQPKADVPPLAYGYVTDTGAFLVSVHGAQGLTSPWFQSDKFYQVDLSYIGEYEIKPLGYFGSYFKTKVGSHEYRILFSRNTDVWGRFYVFYADPASPGEPADPIRASEVAKSRTPAG